MERERKPFGRRVVAHTALVSAAWAWVITVGYWLPGMEVALPYVSVAGWEPGIYARLMAAAAVLYLPGLVYVAVLENGVRGLRVREVVVLVGLAWWLAGMLGATLPAPGRDDLGGVAVSTAVLLGAPVVALRARRVRG